jgi:hypothetical protein
MPTPNNRKEGPAARSGLFASRRYGNEPVRRFPRAGGWGQQSTQTPRRFSRSGGTTRPAGRGTRFPGISTRRSQKPTPAFMDRLQERVPLRGKTKDKQSKLAEVASGLRSTLGDSKSARSRRPSKKGMFGLIAAAGVGAAAVANRSRGSGKDGSEGESVQPVDPGLGGADQPTAPIWSQESPPAG